MNRNFNNIGMNSYGFQPMATSCNNYQPNNFNNNFQNTQPLIGKTDFKNKNNTLHNNLQDNLFSEQVIEYYINIDSCDRKLDTYPSPFDFIVSFGGIGQTIEKNSRGKEIVYNATPAPIIDRSFRNVKYVKLDYVILPRTLTVKISNPGDSGDSGDSGNNNLVTQSNLSCTCLLSNNEENALTQYKFIMLRIKELASERILGTNRNISSDTFILYPDKIMGKDHIMWLSTWSNRIFKTNLLGNIERLTIEILDPDGNILQVYDHEGNVINLNKDKRVDDNVKHQLQANLALIFGVLENDMATQPKFEY